MRLITGRADEGLADQDASLADIRRWFASRDGRQLLDSETAIIDQLLPDLFGYHLLQLSVADGSLFSASPIGHKASLGLAPGDRDFIGNPAQLPFSDDSVDVLLLHHMLDFCDAPQQVLREVSRITLSGGHLIIAGFNPVSTWGLCRPLLSWRRKPPWHASFIRLGRLMDWLNLLDFRIDRAEYTHYLLPGQRGRKPAGYPQGLSRRVNWPLGAAYLVVASKHVAGMTRIKPVWSSRAALVQLDVARARASARVLNPPQRE